MDRQHYGGKDRLDLALEKILPVTEEDKEDDVKSLTKEYHKYKRKYVKHIFFSANKKNLRKSITAWNYKK